MSDILKSNTSSARKRRISDVDETIEYLTNEVKNLNDFVNRTEFEFSLMTVKLKREKVNALAAVARSRMLLADMDVLIAESDLFTDLERLKNFKIPKLDQDDEEGSLPKNISKKTPLPTTSTSEQTTNSYEKKKKKHRSSKKAPVDISEEETVLIPKIKESIPSQRTEQSLNGPSLQTSFTPGLFNTPPTKSDSETSLSSSIKAEFFKPYSSQALEPEKKPKRQKSEKQAESKSKSKHISKPMSTQSPSTPKTVADLRKSTPSHVTTNMSLPIAGPQSTANTRPNDGGHKTTCTSTYVPVRHNMPAVVTRPRISDTSAYVNYVTQPYLQYHTQNLGQNQSHSYYGSQQS